MSDPRQSPHRGPGPHPRERLQACARKVELARIELQTARGTRSGAELQARADLLDALETYAGLITQLGGPVPYRLHAEIELNRGLGNSR